MPAHSDQRKTRLAEALRANLKRRKAAHRTNSATRALKYEDRESGHPEQDGASIDGSSE
jgi:hypothetical protein